MEITTSSPERIDNGFTYGHKYQFLNGSVLKIIAILTMFIDHFCAVLLSSRPKEISFSLYEMISIGGKYLSTQQLDQIYDIGRSIGRLAFPLFCFLLVQGFVHSKNNNKYTLRLLLFAALSEIPFNYAFFGSLRYWYHNNVFFTLLLGHLALRAMERFKEKPLIGAGIVFLLINLAQILHTDYGAFGVVLIVLLYMARNNPAYLLAVGILTFVFLPYGRTGLIAFLLMCLYNGKRGLKLKYFFYAFYPVHLLLLFFLRYYMMRNGLHLF